MKVELKKIFLEVKIEMNKRLLNLTMLILMFFVFLLSNSFATEQIDIIAISAPPGGSWYTIMGGMAEIIKEEDPNINIKVTPGGSLENVLRVASNEAQLGFTFPLWIIQALEHSGDYANRPKIEEGSVLILAGGFGSSPKQFVIFADLAEQYGIKTVKDLFDKKVPMKICVNKPGSSELWSLEQIFEFYGVTFEDLKSWGGKIYYGAYNSSIQLLQDKHANALIVDANPPASPILEVQLSRKLKLIPLNQDFIDYLVNEKGHDYAVIPAGTYEGQDVDIPTATMLTLLITNNKLPEDVAYSIIKIMDKNKERIKSLSPALKTFDTEISWKTLSTLLHPGAEKAYKELGYIK